VIEMFNSCIERELDIRSHLGHPRPNSGLRSPYNDPANHTDRASKCVFVNRCVCRLTRLMRAPHSHS
jgi:hypothetical protein